MSEKTPKVQPEKPAFDEKKKNALLRYVAILFAAAFLVVLLSMLSQMRDNRHTISQLNQSSTSALQKAEQLQDTNRVLEENNEFLKEEVDELNQRIDELEQQLTASDQQQQDLEDEGASRMEQLQTEKEKIQQAYELLLQLVNGKQPVDLEKLEALKSYLGPKGLETYETALQADKGEENND